MAPLVASVPQVGDTDQQAEAKMAPDPPAAALLAAAGSRWDLPSRPLLLRPPGPVGRQRGPAEQGESERPAGVAEQEDPGHVWPVPGR